ncbi:hypothetical protein BTW15_03030 [Pseudomonas syringae pv. tomato]|uniref:Uncharacterized protein n=2 Tax=Pseudomonas syringae pv. tomato TaxID=323 RepID=Q883T7_PSESM|nr:hypothetical protein PSPTO_2263 [Pseudomonas syringae pv. tomato str. DC3000]AVI85418.1 hypothetical protein XJ28_17770 [Pseudomonas syringae pv. tomato]EEB60652.1 hypothetical protein PSPTOT1_5008 [Pseudomonas syringae pv. tomato T1]MCF5225733.1 hypothetical protein [Pseudomonas syringae]PYD03469.1 hypothetical protein DND90_01175 [Pseudomonas syringae pv. maculicola]
MLGVASGVRQHGCCVFKPPMKSDPVVDKKPYQFGISQDFNRQRSVYEFDMPAIFHYFLPQALQYGDTGVSRRHAYMQDMYRAWKDPCDVMWVMALFDRTKQAAQCDAITLGEVTSRSVQYRASGLGSFDGRNRNAQSPVLAMQRQ